MTRTIHAKAALLKARARATARLAARYAATVQADKARAIDAAAAELTRFASLAELCDACTGGYRLTLRADLDPRFAAIADAFDAEMARRGDPRRAFRG